jgi:thiamine transport system permease protein
MLLWLLPLVFLAFFYFYPLGSILAESFARAEGGAIFQLWDAITSPYIRHVMAFTFQQAALSTLLTLLLGLPGAYILARYRFWGKSTFQALSGIPFVLPPLVVASAFNALMGPRGWLNIAGMALFNLEQPPVQFLNTYTAIIVAHVFYNTTIVLRIVGDYWAHLDLRLGQAAQVLGAKPVQAWLRVTLPLLTTSIAAAALLVFIFDFTSFGVILILGGPRFATLEVEIYTQTVSMFNLPLAAALALLQLLCTLVLTLAYTRLVSRLAYPLSLRPQRLTQRSLTTARSRLGAGLLVVTLSLFLITPLAALALRSIAHWNAPAQSGLVWSIDFYRELFTNRQGTMFYVPPTIAVGVSLAYASITVLLALAVGLPAAWSLAYHKSSRLNRLLDPVIMLPLGTSPVTLGLGFIIALDTPPLDLRASPLLVPLAHSLVAMPFVVRSLTPALRSIRPQLRQAAAVMGASPFEVFRWVDLHLVGRAILVAATFAFTISIGEFGATALIARPEYPTIPIAIFRYLGRPGEVNYGQALALSTILMLVTAAGMLAIERFRIAEIGEF